MYKALLSDFSVANLDGRARQTQVLQAKPGAWPEGGLRCPILSKWGGEEPVQPLYDLRAVANYLVDFDGSRKARPGGRVATECLPADAWLCHVAIADVCCGTSQPKH